MTDRFIISSNPFLDYVNPVIFYVVAGISAFGGILISRKVDTRKFLLSWIVLGVLSTLLMSIFQKTVFVPFLSIPLGFSLGLGLPSSMAHIADCTKVEERARISGTIIFMTFGLAILAMLTKEIFSFGLAEYIILIALVRSTSLISLVLDKFDVKNTIKKECLIKPENKDFIFYIIPWLMFILGSTLAWNLIPRGFESAEVVGQILRLSCIAVFGYISGVVADRFGRKSSIIIGLLLFGISFGILGFAISDLSVIIYLTASGVAWGFIFAIYLAIPGDLSICGSREKFYALIMVLPLILMTFVPIVFQDWPIPQDVQPISQDIRPFSQVLSVITFLSIIPIWRANETLPDIKMRERRLKDYVEKVGKVVSESSETD